MRKGRFAGRLSAGLVGGLAICAVSLGVAPAASAQDGGANAAAIPQLPPTVTVGDGQTGSDVGTNEATVLQAAPTVVTQVSDATIAPGETFTDTATIGAPAGAPPPTGTVSFFVYGPNDATCAGAPIASSLNRPIGPGGTVTSEPFTPTAPGTYRMIAVYSGDANYSPATSACNDPNETVVVEEPPPPPTPTSKEQCKNGGWRTYGVFKNQGDCVSFVATNGKNPPAGPR